MGHDELVVIKFFDAVPYTYIVQPAYVNTLLAEQTIGGGPVGELMSTGSEHACESVPPQACQIAIGQFSGLLSDLGPGEGIGTFLKELVQFFDQ